MKKIGLVGGISWASTLDYYRIINEEANKLLGGLQFPECIIYSLNFDDFRACNAKHNWQGSFELLSNAALQLKRAGADLIILGANTAHIVADEVAQKVGLPLVDIRTATANAIREHKMKKVGLMGTVYTMELDFYKRRLMEYSIEAIIPENSADRQYIERTLLEELGRGIILEETKAAYIRIADDLVKRGAEGIILGCTEIPLLIKQEDMTVPAFNTTEIHARAAVQFALTKTSITN